MAADVPVITIDGPSGSGKGVITHRVAAALGFHILDSGALYRLIGLAARRRGIPFDDEGALAAAAATMSIRFEPTGNPEEPLRVLMDGADVTLAIRTDQAGADASAVAPLPRVRDAIKAFQRGFRQAPGLVADGRDMGTVVFPGADVKIYLTASAEARAERRYNQLKHKDIGVSLHDLFSSIRERDRRDMERTVAPLRPAEDAVTIDSTTMSIDEVFAAVMAVVTEKLG